MHISRFNCTLWELGKKSKLASQSNVFLFCSYQPALPKNNFHTPGHSHIFQLRFKTAWGNTNCPASEIHPADRREPSTSTESSIFPLQQLGTQSGKVFFYHPEHCIMKCWGNHLAWIESKFSTGENIVREVSGEALAEQCRSSQKWGHMSAASHCEWCAVLCWRNWSIFKRAGLHRISGLLLSKWQTLLAG